MMTKTRKERMSRAIFMSCNFYVSTVLDVIVPRVRTHLRLRTIVISKVPRVDKYRGGWVMDDG